MKINLASLTKMTSAHAPETFKVSALQGGNLKITFADLRAAGSGAPEGVSQDEHKYTKLIRLCRHLRDQGVPAQFSASFDSGKKDEKGRSIWVPYPTVYVNTTVSSRSDVAEVKTEVEARMSSIEATLNKLTQLLAAQAAPEPKAEPEAEGEPSDERPGF